MTDRTIFFEGAYYRAPEGITVKAWLKAVKADTRMSQEDKTVAARLAAAFEKAGVK